MLWDTIHFIYFKWFKLFNNYTIYMNRLKNNNNNKTFTVPLISDSLSACKGSKPINTQCTVSWNISNVITDKITIHHIIPIFSVSWAFFHIQWHFWLVPWLIWTLINAENYKHTKVIIIKSLVSNAVRSDLINLQSCQHILSENNSKLQGYTVKFIDQKKKK